MKTNDTRVTEQSTTTHASGPELAKPGTPAADILQEVYERSSADQATPPETIIAKLEVYLGKPADPQHQESSS
jgi:hypothetical protein